MTKRKHAWIFAAALIAAVPVLAGGVASAAAGHHHRRHHHHHPVVPAPAPAPAPTAPAASPCNATPRTVALALSTAAAGDFSASILCTGLVTGDPITFTAPRLAADCAAVTFDNIAPSITKTADFAGRVAVSVHGVACGTGDMSVQVTSFYTSLDVPISLTA